ncbi:MAG TPA: hypothetical protein VEW05_16990 [Candidatus Polarisedimenticolia bacterium]|nr:hypothetical protein [Candidatus Polarisedimenticolia bacterium]
MGWKTTWMFAWREADPAQINASTYGHFGQNCNGEHRKQENAHEEKDHHAAVKPRQVEIWEMDDPPHHAESGPISIFRGALHLMKVIPHSPD